jgi:tetratricopeptide (TPR) repeat protein
MHRVARMSLALTVGGYLQAVSAFAQTPEEWLLCLGQDFSSPDLPIKGCTAIIQTGQQVIDRLATAYNNRGVAYRLKVEYDKAIEDFNEAIRLRPHSPTTFNNRAVAYRNKGDLDHALADYNEAIRLNPNYIAALYNRGLLFDAKKEYERAIDDFNIALKIDPRNPFVLFRRGEAFLKKGSAGVGNADIAAAKAINPDIAEAIVRGER